MTLDSPNNLITLVKILNPESFRIFFRYSVNNEKKAANSYPLTKKENRRLVNNVAISNYKEVNNNMKNIIKKAKRRVRVLKNSFVKLLHINGESNCFITAIDHKENSENKLIVELINLVKNDIEGLIRITSDKINAPLRIQINYN